MKRIKPDVILIAEPWSFKGHIGGALRDTGSASWMMVLIATSARDFVRGGATREGYEIGAVRIHRCLPTYQP
ncbi:MAG: hypothetical protein QM760_16340 [Nibricoccus sp.]